MIKVIKTVFLTLLFILGITFSMENNQPLVLRYYFGLETPPVPVFLLALFSVLLGVFIAGVGFLFDERSFKKALREKEGEMASLERELKLYRERERPIAGAGTKDYNLVGGRQ